MRPDTAFWPNGARLAVTVSMQFEAGGQPISGASGPVTEPIQVGYPDLPQNSFYEYGVREGIPRMLDLFDRHAIKVTSFMIGEAVARHPALAAEIVDRGHEAAAHGRRWESQYLLEPEAERQWIRASVDTIEQATGQRPRGYNSYWMRGSAHTLEILQQLGFTYHIDDLSADEPFVQELPGGPFVTVPYTVHMNDIASFDFAHFAARDYEQQLQDEFEQLYEEGAARRRMMSLSLHDRISGHASRVRALDRFFSAVGRRRDVWWARRDEIADWALATPRSRRRSSESRPRTAGYRGTAARPWPVRPASTKALRTPGFPRSWSAADPCRRTPSTASAGPTPRAASVAPQGGESRKSHEDSSPRGPGSSGDESATRGAPLMSNERVIDEIRATLERDPRINNAAQVAVSEQAGQVTLRGTVRSLHQRRVALGIAKSVQGVNAVTDELRVDPRDHALDDQIRGAALQELMSNDEVPDGRIDVRVADGWLTLTGEVKRQRESTVAFEAVSNVAGVGGITNKITVITAGMDG